MVSVRLQPQSRAAIHGLRDFVLNQPETLAVSVVTGDEDLLVHVAVPTTRHLQDFCLDRLTQRPEIRAIRTAIVFEHHRSHVLTALS
jgi:DNA-binding Lrp family transcriptional regulator